MLDVELLRREQLTEIINSFRLGELRLKGAGILPEAPMDGQTKSWDIRGIARDIGKFQGKHSPAGTRKLSTIGQQTARLARTFIQTPIQGSYLLDLRRPGSLERQQIAEDQFAEGQLDQRRVIDRQDEYMIANALRGSLTVNVDGMDQTVNYGLADDHDLEVAVDEIPVSWDDPGADILEDLQMIKTTISEDSGFTAAKVWCGSETIKRLMKNGTVEEYFSSTPQGVDALTQGTIARFYGLDWTAYDGGYLDDAGNFVRFIPENEIIVTPLPSKEWGEMAVGTDVVPTDDDKGMVEVRGLYSYARGQYNPASVALFAGKVRLPIIKIPGAIVRAKIT